MKKEDSLYTDTYEAFKNELYDVVARNTRISEERYPIGANRDKFIFIGGLTQLNMGDADSCCAAMRRVVKEYPQSDVAVMAGMIINGVDAGRKLYGAKFDIADIWNYRAEVLNEENDTTEQKLTDDPNQEFIFLMTYNPDSIGNGAFADSINIEHKLLYEIAKYNFTSYLVRNFDISIEEFQGLHRIAISGFNNFDEALVYARDLYQNNMVMSLSQGSRNIIISRENLPLLGTRFSYNEYDDFYNEHFAALPQPDDFILNEQIISPETYNPEMQESEEEKNGNDNDNVNENDSDNDNDNTGIIIEEPKQQVKNEQQNATSVTIEEPKQQVKAEQQNATSVTIEEPKQQVKTEQQGAISNKKAENGGVAKKTEASAKNKTTTKNKTTAKNNATTRQDINADIIEIIDDSVPKQKTQQKKKEEKKDDDDEYFELEGF